MGINRIDFNGNTLIDLSTDTVASAADIVAGKVGHLRDGTQVTGTASGGGSSSWTLVASTSYQVSTTSTSVATVATWVTGDSSIWTSDKIVYIRIRDTAGKRAGYFYGTDNFFINYLLANGDTSTSMTGIKFIWTMKSSGVYARNMQTGTTGNGVYVDTIYSDGRIRIRSRYNSSNSLTIDGTYSVEVYLLTPPSAIFE